MGKKHPLKSKTIIFALITIVVAIFNMIGIGDKPVAEMTWKELGQKQSSQTDQITNLLILFGGGGAVYGRVKAKDKIGRKKDED